MTKAQMDALLSVAERIAQSLEELIRMAKENTGG